jgi:hypothetical protein
MPIVANNRKSGIGVCASLLPAVNFLLYAIITAIAAYLYDKLATLDVGVVGLLTPVDVYTCIVFSLLAGSVGMAASILGFFHGGFFTESSRFGSLAANFISLALTFLAAGFAIRGLRSNRASGVDGTTRALKSLFAFDIILMFFSLGYAIYAGMFRHESTEVVDTSHHAGKHHDVESTGYAPSSTVTHSAQTGQHAFR